MKILFCSFDSPGHLFPQIGLALELRERGHEVAFATGHSARDTLAEAELDRIPRGVTDGDSFSLPTWFKPLRVAVDVKHVEHAIRCFAPDRLVTQQLCQAPLLVRERVRIPVAVMGLFSYLWPVRRPVSPGRFASREPTRRWRLEDGTRYLNEARELFRMAPLTAEGGESWLRGDAFMLRAVPELEPELEALPPGVRLVGPCLWEPPHGPAEWEALRHRFPDPDAAVLYVQQGSTFKSPGFWSVLVEALAGQPLQVVASTGRMDKPVGDLPPNFLAEPHVPQGLVMRHARAVVSGGTTTPVLGALAHGLPSVLVPSGGETLDNAEKVAMAECALSLNAAELTPQSLLHAIDQMIADGPMRRRCAAMQGALARMGSFGVAADLVEQLGASAAKPRRVARVTVAV
jgi:MGT family glycosyltransferase